MSTHEIKDYIHHHSIFSFTNGNQNEGIIIAKYNIAASKLEHYFVNVTDMCQFQKAYEMRDQETLRNLMQPVNIETIVSATEIN